MNRRKVGSGLRLRVRDKGTQTKDLSKSKFSFNLDFIVLQLIHVTRTYEKLCFCLKQSLEIDSAKKDITVSFCV